MIHTDFMLEQIRRFLERLSEVRKAVQQGARARAADDLDDLLRDVDDFSERTAPEQRGPIVPVRAQVHGELGMVLAGAGAAHDGLEHLETALALLLPLAAQPDADGRLVELYCSILLNAGATHAATRDFDTARARLDDALERLRARPLGAEAGASLTSLRVAALQNRAMIHQQRDDLEAARGDLEAAIALAEQGRLAGERALGGLSIDLYHRLTLVHRRAGHWDDALASAQAALEVAESLVEDEWGPFAVLYLRAKMIVADVCFDAGRLGDGENALFEAIESVPELIDPVLTGIDHYLALWRRSDEALDAGGLPRDEVGDSLAELMAALDARRPDDAIRAIVWARYDLVVNGDRAAAERVAEQSLPQDVDPRLVVLRERLESELAGGGAPD